MKPLAFVLFIVQIGRLGGSIVCTVVSLVGLTRSVGNSPSLAVFVWIVVNVLAGATMLG